MFGYVLVEKQSLRIREYDYYRATYCGLCHAMGKCTGCLSRLTLSYDMTFFALLRECLTETDIAFEKKRCIRHPLRAIETVKLNPQLEYSAYAGGILATGKILDNLNDERGIKRALAGICKYLFATMGKKSEQNLPELAEFVNQKLQDLANLESNRVASIDAPADIFGEIMARMLSFDLVGDKKIIADAIGKRIGRWIYIVDAFDDYEKDRKNGSYNPFVLLYDKQDFTEDNLISISTMLEAELSMAFSALELLGDDGDTNRIEIIKNILCLGMPASVARVCGRIRGTEKK